MIARVAVAAAVYSIDRPYDYVIPESLLEKIQPGMRVIVPFSSGNRCSEGIVLALSETSNYDAAKLKEVSAVVDESPILSQFQIKLALFVSERFFCTVYCAVKAMLPAGIWNSNSGKQRVHDKYVEYARLTAEPEIASDLAEKMHQKAPKRAEMLDLLCSFGVLQSAEILHFTGGSRATLRTLEKTGLVSFELREVFRRPKVFSGEKLPLPQLNAEQESVFAGLSSLLGDSKAHAALLHGVTGSGKTAVYLRLIAECLKRDCSAMLLVPEIALTPQMLVTFSARFGDSIAVMHSGLSLGERYDEWKRIRSGAAKLVIGTRSAVFAPLEDVGLIIIDEEQEESYKSENAPRYNTRDVAKYICARKNALLLMGSATPDVSSMYNALTGKYSYFSLRSRYNEQALPSVEIVDMRSELRKGQSSCISNRLLEELQNNIERGEQSILFVNRRGANTLTSCCECGTVLSCPRCSVALTFHSVNGRLMCHHCGFSRRYSTECPECGGALRKIGVGTQLVEEELRNYFPGSEIIRVDTDSVLPVGSHEPLFEKFRNENIPIMIGTQMVSKGLNFENVTLVGVISADQSLYSGSYKSGERTFSMLTQVIGRCGRGEKNGRALIQTYTPQNEIIKQAALQDYSAFYEGEIRLRSIQNAPPFADLISVTVMGTSEPEVMRCCTQLKNKLNYAFSDNKTVQLFGPIPYGVVKVNNRFRYKITVSCKLTSACRSIISNVLRDAGRDKQFNNVIINAISDPID